MLVLALILVAALFAFGAPLYVAGTILPALDDMERLYHLRHKR